MLSREEGYSFSTPTRTTTGHRISCHFVDTVFSSVSSRFVPSLDFTQPSASAMLSHRSGLVDRIATFSLPRLDETAFSGGIRVSVSAVAWAAIISLSAGVRQAVR